MYPHLFRLPVVVIALIAGGLIAAVLSAGAIKRVYAALVIAAGALIAALFAYSQPWGQNSIPVQGYGVMILAGFLFGVWMAARRSHLIGVEPRHCVDIGVYGVVLGLIGSRAFHVAMHWADFNPFHAGGFDASRVGDMFKLWEGGLVFYGAFMVVLPYAWLYCKYFKLPALPFLDLAVPSVIAGLAFGRIGCFLNGCCFGKICDVALPWWVQFPKGSPAYEYQRGIGEIPDYATQTFAVHPTQIYASIAAALTAAFLYTYWPRRKYDGQILSLMLIMAGATRFFEEVLRSDDVAAFPTISQTLTIAQWLAMSFVVIGFALLLYFRKNRTHFKANLQPV